MTSLSALAGFVDGRGTQGLVATDNIASDDTRSVFFNENDTIKTALYGASLVEVQGTGNDQVGGRKQWTFDATADVIGDLYLRIAVEVPSISTQLNLNNDLGGTATNYAVSQPMGALNLINRIDFTVGTQIYQTMYRNDILHILTTEQSTGSMNKIFKNLSGANSYPTAGDSLNSGLSSDPSAATYVVQLEPEMTPTLENTIGRYVIKSSPNDKFVSDCVIPLSMFTRNFNPQKQNRSEINESGYFLFAAPDQQVQITVHFSDGKTNTQPLLSFKNLVSNSMFGAGLIPPTSSPSSNYPINIDTKSWSTHLFYRQLTLCNSERQAFRNNTEGIPKTIKTTEGIPSPFTFQNGVSRYTLDLSTFNLLGSHLIFSYIQYYTPGTLAAENFEAAGTLNFSNSKINFTAELLLNNTSVFGQIPSSILSNSEEYLGLENFDPPLTPGGGGLPGLPKYIRDIDSYSFIRKKFVIPLASRAYGGSMIPLNRFDNIRLILNFTGINLPATAQSGPIVNPTIMVDSPAITCAGTTTILYKGGAASLAIY